MTVRPEVLEAARQWVQKAEEDMTNAVHTLKLRQGCPFATVCFHAQQTVEKYLKALLTLHSVPFPKTHDLGELLALVPNEARPDSSGPDLAGLNVYASETRYPGDRDPFTRVEAEAAVALASRVRDAIRVRLPAGVLTG